MPRESPTAPWAVGNVRLRRVRGPRADGLVYWRGVVRGEDGGEKLIWKGWARRNDPEVSGEILDLAGGPAPEERAATVRTLLGYWRAEQEARAGAGEIVQRSLTNYVQAIRYLSVGLGDVLLERLDVVAIRDFVRARQSGRVVLDPEQKKRRWAGSSQTIQLELVVLAASWAWGRRRGVAPDHDLELPAHRVIPVRDRYTPTPAEVGAVLSAIRPPWARAMVVLLSSTGLRIGELMPTRWRQVDLDREVLHVDGKGRRKRDVPLSALAVATLRQLGPGEPDGWVLGVRPAASRYLRLRIAEACEQVGVPRWTPHAMRRLALDRLYESGADVGLVAVLLGQSAQVALQHYRQPRPDAIRRAVERAALGQVPEGRVLPFEPAAKKG